MASRGNEGRSRAAKVGHRKSRNGCLKCKSRRVKCDERRPTCGNCNRLQMDCSWPSPPQDHGQQAQLLPTPSPGNQQHLSPSAVSNSTSPASHTPEHVAVSPNWPRWPSNENIFTKSSFQLNNSNDLDLPESKARRLMEHRLMQNWYLVAHNPFPLSPAPEWRDIWAKTMPAMALKHENILFGISALSATNLLRSEPEDKDIYTARESYFIAALHAQREEVAKLTVDTAEVVCFGALLISIAAFAMLQERTLTPYQPPMDWLQVGRGAGIVIRQSIQTIFTLSQEADHPALMNAANTYPYFGRDHTYFSPEHRVNFHGVLTQHLHSGDDWGDEETREAYEKTLSYVGSIQSGLNHGEPVYAITRRIQAFPLLIPAKYIELLSLQRPRALVVLAHFWATIAQVHNVWWLGDEPFMGEESTAKREIRAISGVLPRKWLTTMVWPMDMVDLKISSYSGDASLSY
ncbi:hypothetical protein J7T55_012355 [Diaporthe amygdali]|uniref:uncharacterized protein n=1 Tax=Phomopsis amygdali TaxID=1214568 RepID=UPI0022FF3EB7|nr:uncharacterized protein J7T55_012355 [Diaporthe amygdali]KAJ0123884.1 hypothetical protein J7T55_012355 [Diaporthe amygdali]